MIHFTVTRSIIENAIEQGVFPGASIEVGTPETVVWQQAFGRLTYAADAASTSVGTLFDLASLTKVIVTTTLAMRLVEDRRLHLSDRLSAWLPEWRGSDRGAVTVQHLLAHTSGLSAWLPLYRTCAGRQEFQPAICGLPLEYTPGTEAVYSDLGFMLLGFILADAAGAPLDVQFSGLSRWLESDLPRAPAAAPNEHDAPPPYYLGFLPAAAWRPQIAPTEVDTWRGRLLVGEVHDENAWALGGVAGHAGLFGTAPGVGLFARWLLCARLGLRGDAGLARPETLDVFTGRPGGAAGSRALGWDIMRPTSSCGRCMSSAAFGHTGFTGTSLWCDPAAPIYIVLLTNRVHPSRASEVIGQIRPAVHDSIMEALGAA